MKKILIAVDYNPSAEKVAETGYTMAKAMGAEVTIVHVITDAAYYAIDYSPIMGYQGGYTAGTMELIEDIKKEAELFLAASVKHLGDSQIKTVVLEGDTIDSIITYSQEWPADLIVMGSHSHRGLERLFVSDVATHVLKQSKIPLLIIPVEDK
ncbi:MAG TPA: universal stress protein [Ferruginibacter sp.]|nr:universal stress protein [Ferruginibacter sp.]